MQITLLERERWKGHILPMPAYTAAGICARRRTALFCAESCAAAQLCGGADVSRSIGYAYVMVCLRRVPFCAARGAFAPCFCAV